MIKLILLLMLTSCVSTSVVDLEFNRIHSNKYIENVYDCSNKSAEFLTYLHANGFTDSRIWFVLGDPVGHAIVEYNGKSYDLVSGQVNDNMSVIRSIGYKIEFKDLANAIKYNPKEWKF